jgi:hypothetical protein
MPGKSILVCLSKNLARSQQQGCGTVQTGLLGAVRSHVPAWPVFRNSFSGELQAGGNSICLCALMAPQKATVDSLYLHFRGSYPIDVSHLSFNLLYLLLPSVSISMGLPHVLLARHSKVCLLSHRSFSCSKPNPYSNQKPIAGEQT